METNDQNLTFLKLEKRQYLPHFKGADESRAMPSLD